jgi:hypothetical protein
MALRLSEEGIVAAVAASEPAPSALVVSPPIGKGGDCSLMLAFPQKDITRALDLLGDRRQTILYPAINQAKNRMKNHPLSA